jgi:hypothetical protein
VVVAAESWLLRDRLLAPVWSVVTVRAVTRLLGSEMVDERADEDVVSTPVSRGSFSSMSISCEGKSRAPSFAASAVRSRLRRRHDTVAMSIGREEYGGGQFLASTIRA